MQLINIYAPNISKDNLIALTYLQLSASGDQISMRLLPNSRGFRAPQIAAEISTGSALVLPFIIEIFNIARSLGATQFVFQTAMNTEARRNSTDDRQRIRQLQEEIDLDQLIKMEIY